MDFDLEGTFGDDYLYFYEESIDEQHSDDDAAEILGLLQLDPGARVLDAPCGHGRLSRRLAAAGMVVTGVDLSEQFIALAKADPVGPGVPPDYLVGDLRRLPTSGPFDAVVCWFTSFGYYDDTDCRATLSRVPPGAPARGHRTDRDHAPRCRGPPFHGGARRHRGHPG